MSMIERIMGCAGELTAMRRDLHAHPELGFEEVRTAGLVAGLLDPHASLSGGFATAYGADISVELREVFSVLDNAPAQAMAADVARDLLGAAQAAARSCRRWAARTSPT